MTDEHTISLYDAVTDLDLAEFLHHLNTLRSPGRTPDPAHRAAFLAHKAQVLTRLADAHAVSDPAYAEQVRQAATEALTASRDDITTTTGPDRCPVCHTRFTRIRRQRYCSDTCRKTAWRRRHTNAPGPPVVPTPGRRRDVTIYTCPECDTRYHAQQRCEDCNTWCTRVGPGGPCPHCEQPVAVTDLFDPLPAPQAAAAP